MATKSKISRESVDRAKPFLVSAIKKMTMPMVVKIVNAQFPVDEIIDNGMTLLMFCCMYSQGEVLPLILAKGPDLELRDPSKRCALHYACMNGDEQNFVNLLNYMKEQGKQHLFESRTNGGCTPLMTAIQAKNVRIVQLCLLEHMNPNVVDYAGRSCEFLTAQFRDEAGETMRANIIPYWFKIE